MRHHASYEYCISVGPRLDMQLDGRGVFLLITDGRHPSAPAQCGGKTYIPGTLNNVAATRYIAAVYVQGGGIPTTSALARTPHCRAWRWGSACVPPPSERCAVPGKVGTVLVVALRINKKWYFPFPN